MKSLEMETVLEIMGATFAATDLRITLMFGALTTQLGVDSAGIEKLRATFKEIPSMEKLAGVLLEANGEGREITSKEAVAKAMESEEGESECSDI